MHAINVFSPDFDVDDCLAEIRTCLERGWTGMGFKTDEFEAAFCQYAGLDHAHFLSSATAGLHLALEVLKRADGWADGDEVITTALTFVSTNHAILHAGLTPVFCDVDAMLCLDPDAIERAITPRTRAVMFVGLGGNAGQWDRVVALCRRHGLRLVLDAAHQSGTRLNGQAPARDADAAVFSFHAVKNLGTADGGMICLPDAKLDAAARRLSWLGIDKTTFERTAASGTYQWRYDVPEVGFKYHGNSVMAAIGLVQLRRLERDNAERRRLAGLYDARLAPVGGIDRVPMAAQCTPSRHLYQVEVADRDLVLDRLRGMNIHPGVHYQLNTRFAPYDRFSASLPRAEQASDQLLSLPLHVKMTDGDVQVVCDALADAVALPMAA
ncbi:dTDP-4-amino-4,6-dideoxygalactose transaminase [Sphingomonas jejuensis]|uniref:dTDP-4-amino-4,6-dideoxygalactose transaminase n=1 Tax=Sphingomonas jejuensis TaxID=904715 RepID=A0ABX0XIF2_9SPHN|nr:DegT/DnrJ/EryC1/StrS family aminotransferase [Sphingomonas jejuensis]NJC33117.1 dTDP-4-amino-4,6-dideoxygalactose transaminase [Sphingomonas jejuensis]